MQCWCHSCCHTLVAASIVMCACVSWVLILGAVLVAGVVLLCMFPSVMQ